MKVCSKCKQSKDVELFSKDMRKKDGLVVQCKSCVNLYYKENKAKMKAGTKAWKQANPDRVKANNKEYYAANSEKVKANTRAWQQANPAKHNALNAKRRAAKLQRTPSWVADSEWQQFALEEIYSTAKERERLTGVAHHVDHIIPLQGELVSGFHVVENLQVITAYENISKNNSYEVC